jgi:hypothetical protein
LNTYKKIVDFVYSSENQNQLMYEDYERIVKNSDFQTVFFKGYDHPVLSEMYTTNDFQNTIELLKEKSPGFNNFLWDGITFLLKKPA